MERFARLSDKTVDRLLDGSLTDPEFDDVAPLIAQLRDKGTPLVDEATVAMHVSEATSAVRGAGTGADASDLPSPLMPGGNTGRTPAVKLPFLKRRGVVAVMSAVALIGSTAGVAWATDGAKPGDSFYRIDRALEAIGINDGGGTERVAEIKALFEAGEFASGLNQAAEVVPDISHQTSVASAQEASTALAAAAVSVESAGSDTSDQTRQAVGALLRYLSTHVGQVDAEELVGLARNIGTADSGSPNVPTDPPADAPGAPVVPPITPVPPADVPPGPPDDVPPGPPDGVPGGPPQP